jgi:hypothetical protein
MQSPDCHDSQQFSPPSRGPHSTRKLHEQAGENMQGRSTGLQAGEQARNSEGFSPGPLSAQKECDGKIKWNEGRKKAKKDGTNGKLFVPGGQ